MWSSLDIPFYLQITNVRPHVLVQNLLPFPSFRSNPNKGLDVRFGFVKITRCMITLFQPINWRAMFVLFAERWSSLRLSCSYTQFLIFLLSDLLLLVHLVIKHESVETSEHLLSSFWGWSRETDVLNFLILDFRFNVENELENFGWSRRRWNLSRTTRGTRLFLLHQNRTMPVWAHVPI